VPVTPVWRAMLVMPAEVEWIIKRNATDPTSGSLQEADLTSRFLQSYVVGTNRDWPRLNRAEVKRP